MEKSKSIKNNGWIPIIRVFIKFTRILGVALGFYLLANAIILLIINIILSVEAGINNVLLLQYLGVFVLLLHAITLLFPYRKIKTLNKIYLMAILFYVSLISMLLIWGDYYWLLGFVSVFNGGVLILIMRSMWVEKYDLAKVEMYSRRLRNFIFIFGTILIVMLSILVNVSD